MPCILYVTCHHSISVVYFFFILQTYNTTFQAAQNGKTLHCEARLMPYKGLKLETAQQLNILRKWCQILFRMMTSSNENILRVTGHLCGEFTSHCEFPAQRPVTRSFGVFFDLRLNERLSKQSRSWWFETPSCPLWRHSNVMILFTVEPSG